MDEQLWSDTVLMQGILVDKVCTVGALFMAPRCLDKDRTAVQLTPVTEAGDVYPSPCLKTYISQTVNLRVAH